MFVKLLGTKGTSPKNFQVLFLRNNKNQDVEVHEVKEVDFLTIQERLDQGESIFITSKSKQKLKSASDHKNRLQRVSKTRLVTGFYLES
jgi:hypothetical protein